jgi:phage terminase large subunit-like protein
MHQRYDGTRRGRQELLGEILPDVEGAIVTQEMIKHDEMPIDIGRVVVGVDPFGGGGDACGISVAGKAGEHEAFVLADRTCKLGPDGWAKKTIETALEYEADCIVWEANYGGDMVPTVLTHAMDRLNVRIRTKKVWASKAKHIRFEPIGGMYERGEVTHVGSFPELEDEITQFTPQGYEGGESPNRADALVFALSELFPQRPIVSWGDLPTEEAVAV